MRRSELSEKDFPSRRAVGGFNGGTMYAAELEGKFYLIEDESNLRGLMAPEDCQGLEFVRVYEFESEGERKRYIEILCKPSPWRYGDKLEAMSPRSKG